MKQRFKYLFLLINSFFVGFLAFGQDWTRQQSKSKKDSVLTTYVWEAHDAHAAGGKIILLKNGRFRYSAYFPHDFQEHAEGTYWIKAGTLVLTSDLQSDNVKIAINYKDSIGNDSLYNRLLLPVNKAGDTLYNTFYFINGDSSFNGHYDPWFPSNIDPMTVVKKLRVMFYDTGVGSAWVSVTQPGKYLNVTVLSDILLDDRTYKILKDWKFKITGNKLIELSKQK